MIFIDEMKDLVLYKRPFYLPINEKDKRHGSCIFLITPNVQSSINLINSPLIINRRWFQSYFIEKDITLYINSENAICDRDLKPLGEGYTCGFQPTTFFGGGKIDNTHLRFNSSDSNGMIFFNEFLDEQVLSESNAAYNTRLRQMLYKERIRNNKQVFGIYDIVKDQCPIITKTFVNLKKYKSFNLFVDWSYYTETFLRNNIYKLDRGIYLFFDYMTRFLEDRRLEPAGYTKKTVFIPILDWAPTDDTDIWDYKKNINPISMIYRLMKKHDLIIKDSWGDYDFVFMTPNGYFKVNFKKFMYKDLIKFTNNIRKLIARAPVIDPEDEPAETEKARVARIIDDIEKAANVQINNLTGIDNEDPITKSTSSNEREITNSIISSVKDTAEEQKRKSAEKIVSDSVKKAVSKTSTDKEVIEILDNDKEFMDSLLIDLASEEDEGVKISATRAKRMDAVSKQFMNKTVNNKKVSDLLVSGPPKELEKTKLDNIETINEEWKELSFVNFEKEYDLDKDIVAILNHFSTVSNPIGILDIHIDDTSTSEDYILTYTVKMEDQFGQRFTIKFDVPKFKNNRFMRLRGNDKIINGQLLLLPNIKTEEDTAQIVTLYNKIFIRRFGSRDGISYSIVTRMIKALDKCTDVQVTIGDNSRICSKYDLPIDYIDLASIYTRLENKDYIFFFDQDEINNKYNIEDYEDYTNESIPIGYDKNNKQIVFWNCDKHSTVSKLISDLLCHSSSDYSDLFYKARPSAKQTYSDASILNTTIPVIVIVGYADGLTKVLEKAKINYEITDNKKSSIDTDLYDTYDYIKFKDGYLYYELSYASSLLMNGLKTCDTADYSIKDINKRSMWLDFLDQFGGRIKADGLDNFRDLLMDPITVEVCQYYNLPTDFTEAFLYANCLLADNSYNRHTDLSGNRFRTNEIVAAYLYKALSSAYCNYSTQLKRSRTGVTMTMKQSAVIDLLMTCPTLSDASILTPLLEKEAANSVSFKGPSGMNSDRSYGLDKRDYDESMINVLALSTGFAANVAIVRQATIDMNVYGERGYIKSTKDKNNLNTTKSLSITEALTPYGSSHDDPFRTAMTFIQTSKHSMPVKKSMPMLITNGADEALPYMTSDTFAFKAKYDGKVIERTSEYMIIEYNHNGIKEFIDLRELVKKNSDGGFYVTIKLDPKIKGNTFKKNDILAYDRYSYSDNVGATDTLGYNIGTLAKVAILTTDEGYEDSTKISEWLSDAQTSEVVVKKEIVLNKLTNIYDIVTPGQSIQEGDSLITFQDAFEDNDMNLLLKNITDEELVSDLGRIKVKSKVTGKVQDIKIYRTVEKEETSESIQKLLNKYESKVKSINKVIKKHDIKTAEIEEADYALDPIGKLKNARESILIEFYLKYEDRMSIGDKVVCYSAAKGVVKDIFPKGQEPYSEFRPEEKIHAFFAAGSFTARMITSVFDVGAGNKAILELDRAVKNIMDIPFANIDDR